MALLPMMMVLLLLHGTAQLFINAACQQHIRSIALHSTTIQGNKKQVIMIDLLHNGILQSAFAFRFQMGLLPNRVSPHLFTFHYFVIFMS